jgi:flagellar protein FlaG
MQIGSVNSTAAVSATATPLVENEQSANTRQVLTAVRALNQSELYGQDRQFQFSRDPSSHQVVIKVVDPSTGEVLDQIPPEQLLQAFDNLQQLGEKKADE